MTQNLAELYGNGDVTLADRPYRNFGEFIVSGFRGVFVKGMPGPQKDIENYPDKKVHIFYEYNFYNVDPKGYNVNRTDVEWGKDWKMIRDGLIELWQLDPHNPEDKDVYLYNLSQFTESGKYIAYEARRTGETYIKEDTGETKYKTSLWILAVYDSGEECLRAHDEWYGIENDEVPAWGSDATNGAGNTNDDTAKYLPWIEIQVRKALRSDQKVDRDALAGGLANDSVLANQFSINSPEVQELVRKVEAEAKPALIEDDIPF